MAAWRCILNLCLLGLSCLAACATGIEPKQTSTKELPIVVFAGKDSFWLELNCEPAAAEVAVDGIFQGTCGMLSEAQSRLVLRAGEHMLKVSASGYNSQETAIGSAGMLHRLRIRLQPQN